MRFGLWFVRLLNGGRLPMKSVEGPNEYIPLPVPRTTVPADQILVMAGIPFDIRSIPRHFRENSPLTGDVFHVPRRLFDEATLALAEFEISPPS